MSLYDKSSLIQVPSLYKDGTLVSTIPEDRSGDFTVVRGSNLSATRVGEDGYIKKGYENLLLQSNSFDTTWASVRVSESTGFLGYDGSNDAWKIVPNTQVNDHRLDQSASVSGVWTFSIYAKAAGYDFLYLLFSGIGNSGKIIDISPNQGVVVDTKGGVQAIDERITDAGNDWWKITLTYSGTLGTLRIITLPANDTSSYAGDGTSGILIQDAMLNQGLVAYPYLETTTDPVQGGLLENTPRLDWSNGVPAVLVEESRTNLITSSEYFEGAGWSSEGSNGVTITANQTISPEGLINAFKIQGGGASNDRAEFRLTAFPSNSALYSVFVKGTGESTTIKLLNTRTGDRIEFNVSAEGVVTFYNSSGVSNYDIEDYDNGWYRVWGEFEMIQGATNYFQFYPSLAGTESIYIYGAQMEQDATYPTSYIPTYGTSQTRSSETISDNFNIPTTATIYNSFYSDVAETVFVLDQVFNVVVGLNKVAIAFSPTAVKISVGGSIVANATGTYDTSSLTNIQLGSDNGSDYSNAPISGFYVFPEFLTDEELNSLTA